MAKKNEYRAANLYEFKPKDFITNNEIIELANLIRIGVSGDLLANASDDLKQHFTKHIQTQKSKKAA